MTNSIFDKVKKDGKTMNKKVSVMDQGNNIYCVQCQSNQVRIIGRGQYFCADCCAEFRISGGTVTIYSISIDGGLLKIS